MASEQQIRLQIEEIENRKYLFSRAMPSYTETYSDGAIWFELANPIGYTFVPSMDTSVNSYKNYYSPVISSQELIDWPYSENMEGQTDESLTRNPVTIDGIEYTTNTTDKSITLNGYSTADSNFGIKRQNWQPFLFLDSGYYKLTGCPEGGSEDTYCLYATYGSEQGTDNFKYGIDTGRGLIFQSYPEERTGIWITVKEGEAISNIQFSPSLQKIIDFIRVYSPTGNPQEQGWFERIDISQ